MASTFTTILLHIVFSTKNRANLIAADVQPKLHDYLAGIVNNLACRLLAIGGTANHVHMLVSLSKAASVVSLMETVKKESSKWVKTQGPGFGDFYWQQGYGAFSIGQSAVDSLRRYIARQPEHHRTVSFEDELRTMLRKYNMPFDERYMFG
jgi:REP element-mobilizing transposase RayT